MAEYELSTIEQYKAMEELAEELAKKEAGHFRFGSSNDKYYGNIYDSEAYKSYLKIYII